MNGSNISPTKKSTLVSLLIAFCFATWIAVEEISLALTSIFGSSFDRAIAIAPLPVPTSTTFTFFPEKTSSYFDKTYPTNSSVSGRGIKTSSDTIIL